MALFFIIASCQNPKNNKTIRHENNDRVLIENNATSNDTSMSSVDTTKSDETDVKSNTARKTNKYNNNDNNVFEAHKHNSPHQREINSIKKSKKKTKK